MVDVVSRWPVDDAVKLMFNTALAVGDGTQRFEIGRAPLEVPRNEKNELIHGYGIIYPLVSPVLWGSLAQPEDVLTSTYQITYVGRSSEHAQRLSDAGALALVGRAGSGLFINAITVTGHSVIERRTRERGSLTQGSGGLWQVADAYELEVQVNG